MHIVNISIAALSIIIFAAFPSSTNLATAQTVVSTTPVPTQNGSSTTPARNQTVALTTPVPAQNGSSTTPVPTQMASSTTPARNQTVALITPVPTQNGSSTTPAPTQTVVSTTRFPFVVLKACKRPKDCASDQFCNRKRKVCMAKRPLGAKCSHKYQCRGDKCFRGVCQKPCYGNGDCSSTKEYCSRRKYCTPKHCGLCTRSFQCASNNCVLFRCASNCAAALRILKALP